MTDHSNALDGNAAAGALSALFAMDVTTVVVHCAHCSASGALGKLAFYGSRRALVLRCPNCGGVNLRCMETRRTVNLDLAGTAYIEVGRGA